METGSVDPSVECVQTSQEDEISELPGDTVSWVMHLVRYLRRLQWIRGSALLQ